MNKRMKKFKLIMICMLLLILCPMQALAAGSIQTEKPASLAIEYLYEKEPISGAQFSVFRIASVEPDCTFTLTPTFSKYRVKVAENTVEEWNCLAETLAGYALADQLTPDAIGTTDRSGKACFENLKTGLYLILSEKCVAGDYCYYIKPTIAALPGLDALQNDWSYQVSILPKVEREPITKGKTTERAVLKVWDDGGNTALRPASITISLLRDGELFEKVTLNEKNNWSYQWTELAYSDEKGTPYYWSVAEDPAENYSTDVIRKGITFVVTNSLDVEHENPSFGQDPDGPKKPSNLPQTGVLWWPVPVLLCFGAVLLIFGAVRRKEDKR